MLVLPLLLLSVVPYNPPPVFTELATPSFPKDKRLMYGGPTVVDLTRNGYPDLLFGYHGSAPMDIFYNDGNASFTKQPPIQGTGRDIHAITPAPGNKKGEMLFTVSVGGSNGVNPNSPRLFSVTSDAITHVTDERGIDQKGGRGRNALFTNLDGSSKLDIIFTNAEPLDPEEPNQFGYQYQNKRSKYLLRRLPGFDTEGNDNIAATDTDGDGRVELIGFPTLKFFRRSHNFTFKQITNEVLPPDVSRKGVVGVAELDYDNDGDFDLFIARTNTSSLRWVNDVQYDDYLLENRDGKYVDVSRSAKIPRGLGTRGVTVGDFNNDGYMDMFISRYEESNLMLLNDHKKGFKRVSHPITRPRKVHGDTAQAVDLNGDGRVDLVVSHGDHFDREYGGYYKVYMNQTPKTKRTRFLEVCVGSSPRQRSAMHAVVTVRAAGLKMVRRVGEVGVVVSRSYLDCLHFGVQTAGRANVKVRWVGGEVARRTVRTNKRIYVGS